MGNNNWIEELLAKVLNEVDPDNNLIDSDPNHIQELLEKLMPSTSEIIRNELNKNIAQNKRELKQTSNAFKERLYEVWKEPLDLLETLIHLNIEFGKSVVNSINEDSRENIKFQVLIRLHSRACKISWEILELLKNGFTDGAMSRWRTLYEISIISNFIADKPEDLSQKYADHSIIRNRKEILEYQRNCSKLGYEKFTEPELQELEKVKKELEDKYGRDFVKRDYGWANGYVSELNFKGIESNTDFSHFRSFYQMANNYVHAGSKALIFSLGLFDNEEMILAGPSNYGLSDPGWNTAQSLVLTSFAISKFNEYLESIVFLDILVNLKNDIEIAFINCETKLHERIYEEE